MITKNGLNLFKIMLTNTCLQPSEFTNIDNHTDILTGLTSTITYWSRSDDFVQGSAGTIISNSKYFSHSSFMPWTKVTGTLNQFKADETISTNKWSCSTSLKGNYINYKPEEVSVITIEPDALVDSAKYLKYISGDFFFSVPFPYGVSELEWRSYGPMYIYGIPPKDTEYLSITLPKCFNSSWTTDYPLDIGYGLLGISYLYLYANLGYSNKTESMDDYDLNSPVYNKKLNPIYMSAEQQEGKIKITISFKNFESESISVNELGLYTGSIKGAGEQPLYKNHEVSLSGYQFVYTTYLTTVAALGDTAYATRGIRPNLIARKVLPQTVTIPADGIATFKYTIDLSEMQAQEDITYSEK